MRLVLDTNVLISAFVSRGVCHELLEHCEREHEIVSSRFILGEFEEKLIQKFRVPPSEAREARTLLEQHMTVVVPIPLGNAVSRDSDDDLVLATALAGACECVITGDGDLLVLEQFRGIRIVSPSAFWRYEASREPPP